MISDLIIMLDFILPFYKNLQKTLSDLQYFVFTLLYSPESVIICKHNITVLCISISQNQEKKPEQNKTKNKKIPYKLILKSNQNNIRYVVYEGYNITCKQGELSVSTLITDSASCMYFTPVHTHQVVGLLHKLTI